MNKFNFHLTPYLRGMASPKLTGRIEAMGLSLIGYCKRNEEIYIGVAMPELAFTLDSIESFAANFPVKVFEKRFGLTLAHLSDIDFDFCRKAKIKPIYILRRKGIRGFIEQALNKHKPIYLCRDSVWFPEKLEGILEIINYLKDWYEVRSIRKRGFNEVKKAFHSP